MSSVYNHLYLEARNFLKTNPELLVCRSDKGNVTVLITSAQYHEKVMELLNDNNVYEVLPRDPTSNIIRRNNDISKRLKELGYITPRECKNINTYKALPPNFYILIKVHKEGLPGRPIVSSINSPTTKLSAFITEVLKVSFSDYFTYSVKDSESFCQLVKNVQLPAGFVLISLDAVSLFTNISLQLVIQLLDDNWHMIAPNCNIPKDEFLAVITFLFSSNYFVYDGKFYKQKDGCPMGSNPSAILAIIVMTEIIRRACIVLGFTLPFICHYVDDIITAVPETEIDSVRQQFNLVFEDVVSFTVERETNNAVPFLDTLVIRTPDNTLITDWYTKPASSGKFINFQSYHSFKVKTNFILGMKKRIYAVAHESRRDASLQRFKKMLYDNGYPRSLINRLFNNVPVTPGYDGSFGNDSVPPNEPTNRKTIYVSFPYLEGLSNKISSVLSQVGEVSVKLAYSSLKTNIGLFRAPKYKIPEKNAFEVVYQVECGDCGGLYIGQTEQHLCRRISQHKSDARLHPEKCALARHINDTGHRVKFDDIKILDSHKNLSIRKFLEMCYIVGADRKAINEQSDIKNLSSIYCNILEIDRRRCVV
ncbi:uncharacterized protein LOC123317615 [Coccinella septempunctata]|uniref:uncharacterized protein LOC123317615 n=1 Tax=Coccinella septempunctata TaxID=41139 RepID=UPI001D05F883|nr:uncharacterized protein LOC123317615 [Coccinella septempunctata]